MSESQTWREVLAEIIKDPREHERIIGALGINPLTLSRWIRNESTPRETHMQKLFEVVPKLRPRIAEVPDAFSSPPAIPSAIPVSFYRHVFDLYANVSEDQRFWSISSVILQEAAQHLALGDGDLDISVVSCLAPSQGNMVRCLREHVGLGTSPQQANIELRTRFFGAESLAGYVVETCHQSVIANLDGEQRLPHQLSEHSRSAVASPILHTSHIAGCLLTVSTTPDYFSTPVLLDLHQTYATLLTLAFNAEDFYEPHSIQLGIMPSLQVQASYFATFQQRVNSLLKKATADRSSLSYFQAEQRTWWQIAEELLQVSPHLLPET